MWKNKLLDKPMSNYADIDFNLGFAINNEKLKP